MKHDYEWLREAADQHLQSRRKNATADEIVKREQALIAMAARQKMPLTVVAKAIQAKSGADHLKIETIQRRITAIFGPWKLQVGRNSMCFSDNKFARGMEL